MKKILVICFAVFLAATVYADGYKTCKISGTTGTVEVSVYENDTEKGTATVQFSNDTDTPANVSATIKFISKGGGFVAERSITKRVPAQYELSAEVSCGKEYARAEVTKVSGNKCQ